jgi:hypothetical protein
MGRPRRSLAAGRLAGFRDRMGDRPRVLGAGLRDRPTIIHSIAPQNLPSQRVAEKLGSRRLGPGQLPPPYANHPIDLWGQTREEWRSRHR